ncbi:MAG TPA: FprA family A-type flavoprotein [Spirochaetia bacterium]|nr:FprA family A-type flavoprotein [Spirochaetia bacterium]
MIAAEFRNGVYGIGVNDRTTDLFEGLWPISQEGVTYNSYLIKDKKNVLIDLTKEFKSDTLIEQVSHIVDLKKLDYVVVNHMEPDHTGALKTLIRMQPNITILCTPKAKPMLQNYYGISANVQEVADGEDLDLGSRTIRFFHAPFVHWPETMVTWDPSTNVLFSCDAFGGYGALPGAIFDDECNDIEFYVRESLRYYTNIVAKFSKPVLDAIAKLAPLPIEVIAPSHGLIWRKNPRRIIELYEKWAHYATGDHEIGVTLLYGSMYGNTELMMNFVAKGLASEHIPVNVFDVARTHTSYILPSLWVNAGVIIGAPTYEGSLYPAMVHKLAEAGIKRIVNKKAAYFGSWGWSGGAVREVRRLVEPLKWDLVETLEFAGGPSDDDLDNAVQFGARFARCLKGLPE